MRPSNFHVYDILTIPKTGNKFGEILRLKCHGLGSLTWNDLLAILATVTKKVVFLVCGLTLDNNFGTHDNSFLLCFSSCLCAHTCVRRCF